MSSKNAGFDFGLKTFLTCSDGSEIQSPLFLKQSIKELKIASRNHSRKKKGSNNREKARKNPVRVHEKVVNRRTDWFWKLSHELTDKKNKVVSYIDQWYPSTKTCSVCDYVLEELSLKTRYWCCPGCSTKHGRDANASVNILKVGISTLRVGDVSQPSVAIPA